MFNTQQSTANIPTEGKVLALDSAEPLALKIPRHVAIIMDGNGRWAKAKGWHRSIGHVHGTGRVKEIIRAADKLGIKYLTLYAFSTENWKRPAGEIATLMQLLKDYLLKERQELIDNNIKLNALGQIERIPEEVRKILEETMEVTANNTGMVLNFCLSYGGRAEIVRAMQRLALDLQEGRCSLMDITEDAINERLYTSGMPDPDLMIRTSGEYRLSNFLLWQSAYSEIYITDVPWPDFSPEHLSEACLAFSRRKRRFGMTDEILLKKEPT
jgi:undecaprenyl diphosphate synthase